jgi:hypothetical protein
LGASGFRFESGVEHQDLRAARRERLGAGDVCRAGTDDVSLRRKIVFRMEEVRCGSPGAFTPTGTDLCLPVRREFPIMAHSKYGRDNIATITRQHGMRMNRVPRIAFSCLTAPFANELRLHDTPIRNAKAVWCALTDAVYFVVAGGSFSLKLKFKIFAMPFDLLLELPLLAAAWPDVLPALNTQPKTPCDRVS